MIRSYQICIVCVALSVFLAVPASALNYRYIDDKGIVHFTDDLSTVPEKYQARIKKDTESKSSATVEESRMPESLQAPSFPEAPQGIPGIEEADMSEPPAEPLPEAPPVSEMDTETATNLPAEKTATATDDTARDAKTKKLIDTRKTLLEKKGMLDKRFDALLEEKKQLEAYRESSDGEKRIEEYNRNVKRLNEKIKTYKADENRLRLEIEKYNKSLKPKGESE